MTRIFPDEQSQSQLMSLVVPKPLSIPSPPSFASFRFTTIGREPELLKRISVPGPDYQYNDDRASPTPSLQYPSLTPEPSRSRPSLLQALTSSNDHDTNTLDATDEKSQDTPSDQPTSTESINGEPIITMSLTGLRDSFTGPVPRPVNATEQVPMNKTSQEVLQATDSNEMQHLITVDPSSSTQASNFGIDRSVQPPNQPSPLLPAQESRYASLRALQVRLTSALENFRIPDNSEALVLAQAAHTHSVNALSTAHRSHAISQQAVAAAYEAVTAAQESLSAAEKAKAHASDAVIAIEQMGVGGAQGSKSEWEWKTIVSGFQSDLQTLGEWIGEREGEDAAKRREIERIEKARRDEASVSNAMRVVGGGLSPQTVQALIDEVIRRTREAEVRSRSMSTRVAQSPSLPVPQQQLHPTAELEADDARRAWSLEHGHPAKSIVTTETEVYQPMPPDKAKDQERRAAEESATLAEQAKLREEQRQRQEEDARIQQEKREAEIRAQRVRELELQKLEVAKFRMLERERQAQQETQRRPTLVLRDGPDAKQNKVKEVVPMQVTKAQRLQIELEEQRKKAILNAAALKAEIIALEEEAKAAEKEAKVRSAEARTVELKAAEVEAAETKAAEEQAAARAAELREIELREAQSKRRQEVMAQKQRASAETAARILAERAREKNEKSTSPVQPQVSPKTLTHPLPSPVFQAAPLPPVQPSGPEAPNPKCRSVSGGVKSGTSEELSASPPPHLSRSSTAHPQKAGKPIPLPLPLPRPKVKNDKTESSASSQASSAPVTPFTRTNQLPDPGSSSNYTVENLSVYGRGHDFGNLPIIPKSELPPTSPEVQAANLRFVRNGNGLLQGTLKLDPGPAPVKYEPRPVTLPSPHSGATKRKVAIQTGPALPKRPKVRQGSTASKKVDQEPQSPAVPLTSPAPASHIPSFIQSSTDNGSNNLSPPNPSSAIPIPPLYQTMADSFNATAPIPPRLKPALPNFRMRKPNGSNVESPTTAHNSTPLPLSSSAQPSTNSRNAPPILVQATHGKNPLVTPAGTSTVIPVPVLNRPNTDVEPNLNRAPTLNTFNAAPLIPQQRTTPELSRGNAPDSYQPPINRGVLSPIDDGTQISPAICGDGGWDAPAQGDEEMYDGSFRRREAARYTSRNGDQYSPPTRTPPRSLSPPRHPLPNTYRSTTDNYAPGGPRRPALHVSTALPTHRARTPPPRTLSPPPPRSPYLGKRRWVDEETLSHRYYQGSAERDHGDRSFRTRSANTSPPTRVYERPLSPERSRELHSRIGARDADVYNIGVGQSYRPSYPPDSNSYPLPRRASSSYQPPEFTYSGYQQDFGGSGRTQAPEYDRHTPAERPEVAERPQLLERMSTGTPSRGKGAGTPRGSSRGRGRGGKRLEQRISSNHDPTSMTLMNRLEA